MNKDELFFRIDLYEYNNQKCMIFFVSVIETRHIIKLPSIDVYNNRKIHRHYSKPNYYFEVFFHINAMVTKLSIIYYRTIV